MNERLCAYPGCPATVYSMIYCSYHEVMKENELRESRKADPDLVATLRTIKWLLIPLLWAAAWWVFWQVHP